MALFVAALVLALLLMHYLAAVALGDADTSNVRRACLLLIAVVVLMVGTLRRLDSQARALQAVQASRGTETTLLGNLPDA